MKIAQLQEFQDCKVTLRLNNGEVLTGMIMFADLEYEDITVDIAQTNRPDRYKGPGNAVYAVKAADIETLEKA